MHKKVKQNKAWSPEDLAYLKGNIDNRSNIHLSKLMGRTINSLESMKRDIRKGKKVVPDLWYKSYIHKRPSYHHWVSKNQSYMQLYTLHKSSVMHKQYEEVSKGTPEVKMEKRMQESPTCVDARLAGLKINSRPTRQQSKDMLVALLYVVSLAVVVIAIYYFINQNK